MDDVIYRQAAIDAMCESCSDWCDEGVCKKVSAIQKLPPAQQWIPCSKRLPEIDELVLVTDDSGGVKTVDVDRCGQYECSEKRFWYYTQNVVAWMPIPEPWRGEE